MADASGAPLKAAMEVGVYLIKPSLREFRVLMGRPVESHTELTAACRSLAESGQAEFVALTLGEQGGVAGRPRSSSRRSSACRSSRSAWWAPGTVSWAP